MSLKRQTKWTTRENDAFASSVIAELAAPRHKPSYAWGNDTPLSLASESLTYPAVNTLTLVPVEITDPFILHSFCLYVTAAFASTLRGQFYLYRVEQPRNNSFQLKRFGPAVSNIFPLDTIGLKKILLHNSTLLQSGLYYIGLHVTGTGAMGSLASTTSNTNRTKQVTAAAIPASIDLVSTTEANQFVFGALTANGNLHLDASVSGFSFGSKAISSSITATANTTTISLTDIPTAAMTITPAAGVYLVWYTGSVSTSANGNFIETSIYVDGVQTAHSERRSGGTRNDAYPFSCTDIATVDGTQAITGQWRTTGGAATMYERSIVLVETF